MGGIDSFETSADYPESHKRCISVVLRAIVSRGSGRSFLGARTSLVYYRGRGVFIFTIAFFGYDLICRKKPQIFSGFVIH